MIWSRPDANRVAVLALALPLALLVPLLLARAPLQVTLPWVFGDWLVDYAGGFVRRGLSGELVYALAAVSNGAPLQVIQALLLGLFEVFLAFFALALWRAGDWRLTLLLGTSPLWLLVMLHYGPRKDLLLLVPLYAAVALPRSLDWLVVALVALFPLSLLCSEANFAWTPALIGIAWLRGSGGRPLLLWLASASVAVFAACLYWRGDPATSAAICASALLHGIPPDVCVGAISAIGANAASFTHQISWQPWGSTLTMQLLGYDLPLLAWLWLATPWRDRGERRVHALALLACFALSVPLFAVAIDWGRWLMLNLFSAGAFTLLLRIRAGNVDNPPGGRFAKAWLLALLAANLLLNPDDTAGHFFGASGSLGTSAAALLRLALPST